MLLAAAFFAGMVFESVSEEIGPLPSRAQLRAMLTLNQVGFERTAEGDLQPVCFCGTPVSIGAIPKAVTQALIAVEDRRFYYHPGLDPIGIGRAVVRNVKTGRLAEGGSTLTQQLVKKVLLSPRRTFGRKGLEAILSLYIEYEYSKEEILTTYLNRMEFGRIAGRPIVGIEQASLVFFGKHVGQLSLYESALLIGILKAPPRFDPLKYPKAASKRAKLVLSAMVRGGFITQGQAIAAARKGVRRGNERPVWIETRYFTRWIEREFNTTVPGFEPAPGIRVFITLDTKTQQYAERAVARAVSGRNNEAALISMSFDGAVRALVGGRRYGRSQFNRATQALRQPASAFKPFVYLAALERGFTPQTKISDAPLTPVGTRSHGSPPRHYGTITLEDALARSANAASIRVCEAVGAARAMEVAMRLGIRSKLKTDCSITLGTSEVSLVNLTAAYGAFANGGFLVAPYGIAGVSDGEGKILHWRPHIPPLRVMSAKHAREMHRMLRQVVARGTGTPANIGIFAAGKTGTNEQFRDAWFVGYSDRLVTGLWQGNDDFSPMDGVTGHRLAGAWANFNANVRAIDAKDGPFLVPYRLPSRLPYTMTSRMVEHDTQIKPVLPFNSES